ncbi:MAG: hypothetical protein F6K41_08955 [Symploca sp. SIO3E6]|nr:hypothetical protein [Caldora sp. SIO3E6]
MIDNLAKTALLGRGIAKPNTRITIDISDRTFYPVSYFSHYRAIANCLLAARFARRSPTSRLNR